MKWTPPGWLVAGALLMAASSLQAADVTITVNGKVVAKPCTVSTTNATVELGDLYTFSLVSAGAASAWHSVALDLSNCPIGTSRVVATFSGMLAMGFSINLLTLFGLILAIGMVVDDAIVVCENVERNMVQHHLSPKDATIRSMGEIGSSLVAVVLVMAAVFVPAAFLPGTTGQLYKQFAITIVVSVVISGIVALTLTPAMCAVLLKHTPPPTRGFFAWFNRQVDRVRCGLHPHGLGLVRRSAAQAHRRIAHQCDHRQHPDHHDRHDQDQRAPPLAPQRQQSTPEHPCHLHASPHFRTSWGP